MRAWLNNFGREKPARRQSSRARLSPSGRSDGNRSQTALADWHRREKATCAARSSICSMMSSSISGGSAWKPRGLADGMFGADVISDVSLATNLKLAACSGADTSTNMDVSEDEKRVVVSDPKGPRWRRLVGTVDTAVYQR